MKPHPQRTTESPERTPVARALPAPRQTRTSSGPRRSRGPRVPERRRDMMARAGRRLRLAVRPVIRAVKMAHNEQVHAWECILLTSGAAPLTAAGPLRWVPSLNGDRLAAATCRPRTRPQRGGNPGWRPRAKIPAPAIGDEHRGTPPPTCSPAAGRAPRPKALHEYGRLARTISICRQVAGNQPRRRYAASSPRARAGPRCAATCSSPIRATFAATSATRPTRRPAGVPWTTACPGDPPGQPLRQARNRGRRRGGDVVQDESQPLDPSDGTVPAPSSSRPRQRSCRRRAGATDFGSAGTNNPLPEMADLRAAGRTTDSAISRAESAI
jgi:hypothetical protein